MGDVMSEVIGFILAMFLIGAVARGAILLFNERNNLRGWFSQKARNLDDQVLRRFCLLVMGAWIIISLIPTTEIFDDYGVSKAILFFLLMNAPVTWVLSLKWLLGSVTLGIKSYVFYILTFLTLGILMINEGDDMAEYVGNAFVFSLIVVSLLYGADKLSSLSESKEPSSK